MKITRVNNNNYSSRVFAPYGLEGGSSGAKGKNTLITKDNRLINMGSKSETKVEPGVYYFFHFFKISFQFY